jgi:hypothetical protein
MRFEFPAAYRRSFRFGAVVQIISLLLTVTIDDDGPFLLIMLGVWAFFWIAVVLLTRFRVNPSKAELVALRYGPLALFLLVFTAGQYL